MRAKRHDGTEYRGHLTTTHSASSYGKPVFVFDEGGPFEDDQGFAWGDLVMNSFTELLPEDAAEAESLSRFISTGGPHGR